MRIHLISDVHLEHGKMPRSYTPPECDVVILAGDIATGVLGIMWAMETFKVPVIYVAGNHEHWGKRRYAHHLGKMRTKAIGSNVYFLNNDVVEIDHVRFAGCTFWADFNLWGTAPHAIVAAQGMNDYTEILKDIRAPLKAVDTQAFHAESKVFLADVMRVQPPKKTVIVTHHAPSELSALDRYRTDPTSPAYASRMGNFILDTQPTLWVHGHMHNSSDYMLGETRIVCNPRGYAGHELNPDFDPSLVITI